MSGGKGKITLFSYMTFKDRDRFSIDLMFYIRSNLTRLEPILNTHVNMSMNSAMIAELIIIKTSDNNST